MKAKFIFFFLLLSLSFTYAQTIRYVRPVASGSGDGSSWANASSNLQAMINASGVQEVWVAAGTYKPTTGTDRAISFSMKNGVTIYGGFPNDGSGTLANRNPIANETILSGDIGNVGEVNDNSYHVVANGNGINSTAKLDGFVITGGNADKVTLPSEIFGGGIFNDGRNGASCSPSFTNCILRQNSAITGGGVGNSGDSGTCNPTFVNCVFYQNQGYGFCGAFVSQGNVNSVLTNCTFAYNSCMYGGGAIYSARNFGAPNITLKNCILWGNNANTGGNQIRLFSSTLTLSNTTLQSGVNGILNAQSLSTINNNGNILTIDPLFVNASTGDLRLTACSPAINAGDNTGISGVDLANNPRIFNNGVVDMGAYELQSSPITAPTAVSISSTTACQGTSVNLLATCASGTVTWYNTSTGGSSIGTGASFSYTAPVGDNQLFYASCKTTTCETALVATTNVLTVYPTRLYVNASATGGRNNGLTWEDAFTDLNSALLRPTFFCPVEIWVAKGVYKPTNSNIRDAFFLTNKAQLSIYGGFDGTETQLSTRNWKNNPTILSGEIGSPSSITDNSRHLFNLNVNQGGSFKIDGFTLTKTYSENDFGGAIRCSSSSSDGLFTISNCIFTDNYALRGGAVMLSGSPFASSTVLTATITNCLFIKNQAIANPNVILPASGAIYSSAFINGTITNCTFSDNVGLNSGGTIYIEKSDLINSGNIILNYTVKNSIFWNNIPTTEPQLGLNNSQVKISNSILQGGISPTTGTIVNEGNVLDTNPIFVDVANENYSLYACSPAVNLGDNTANSTTTDLAGNQRVFGTKIDMGAYELQSVAVTTPTAVSVSQSAVCQGTSVNLLATCANGTVTWYNTSTGGTSIGTGASLSYTAPVGANQTFYASCKDATCETALGATSNTLTVYAIPSKPTITPPSQLVVCSPSTLTLTANCTTGTVLWSNNATGTSLTLNSVGTYSISAKCVLNGCESDASSTTNLEIKAKPSVPTITPPSQLVVCSPTSLTLTATCASGTVLWSNNSTGTSLTLNSVGTYSISAKCTLNGCDSDQSSITNLEIKAKPATPTITPPSQLVVCSPSTLTLTATCAIGTVLWSNNSTGTSLTLNSVGTYSISAKCVLNGCESDASSATSLEIKAKPATPTITPPSQLVVCSPTSLTLTATCASGTVLWSNNSTGTSLTLNSVGTYSISAKCVLNGCESDASSTTNLEIKAKPSVPTITPPSQLVVCSPTSLTLTATCATGNVLWSNNSTGTSLTLNSVGTYSISAKCTLNGCESDPSSATNLEIKAKPTTPTITPPSQLVVCSPTSLTLTANCTTGTVLWSNNSTGTSLTLNSVGTYSISAKCTLNGCESDPSSATSLEIKAKPSVPIITPPSQLVVCSPTSLTLTATCASGNVVWSNNSTGTSLTLNSVGTYSISAKCTLNGCESDPSSATNLEIKAKPTTPTITPPSQLVVCSPTSLTLTANCTTGTVLWSNNSTGTSLTLNSVGTYSISAKCVQNGCESDPSSATNLEIKAKPSVPTITPPSQLVVCSPTSLTLTATCASGNVVWSNNSTGTSLTLNSVGTYSISAKCVLNGCESDASSATNLEIKAKPSVPTIMPPSQLVVCSPSNLTLTATCQTGNVVWSTGATSTSLILNTVGTYSISAKCTLNGCDSDQSSVTNLEIKAKPSVPTITPPSQLVVCSPSTLELTASCQTGNVVWSTGATSTSLILNTVGTYSISAKCTLNGCDSDQSSATNLEIKALPNVSATNTGPYTVGQSISLVGSGGGTYSWTGPNNFSSSLSTPTISNALSVNGGVYTLTVVGANGCSVAATTNVVVSGVDPCDPSRIVDYLYVKAGNPHQPLFNLTDGMVINQIPEQVSILVSPSLCPSVTIESFEMNIQGPELNWNILQNVTPNALFDNFGSDIWGRNFKSGSYTLTVTGYAQDNKGGGITYGPKIIRFIVVGNLTTINAPTLSKNTICAGSSVDVSFNTSGTFNSSNEFRVELSDSSGSFASPVLIGTTNGIGTLSCLIPQNTLEGVKYLIRVSSSNQVVVSNPAISQVAIHPYSHHLVNPANNLTGTKTKKAVTNINASNKVTSPASVTYQAGKSIVLAPGFESGSVFKAEIQSCEN